MNHNPSHQTSQGFSGAFLVLVAFLCLALGGIGGFVLGGFSASAFNAAFEGAFQDAFAKPQNISIGADQPQSVAVGEQFKTTIKVTNTADEEQELNSIDIYYSYLDNFEVVSVEPSARQQSFRDLNFESFFFYLPIPPGDTVDVTFTLKARQPGTHFGEADVCINTETSFLTERLETEVVEGP